MKACQQDSNTGRNQIIHKLRVWFKKRSLISGAESRRRQARRELQHLSPHLRRDLGFDNSARPLHWSTYSPRAADQSKNVQLAGQKRGKYQHQLFCQS